jgi:UDP-4-amino-4,6-dideoxy-N-acetyl-beta-L-altrosamine transaminase
MKQIPYGRQSISEEDIAAVVSVLKSDFLTQGPAVPAFEAALCAYTGAAHALAVNSATSALHIACLALGVGPGDTVWTTPNTFLATANSARYCGASVDFVDIDPISHNLCAQALATRLATAQRGNTLPKVVIPVHFAGQPADMAAIHELSKQYGFGIIEDASHAIGGSYRGEPVGRGSYSDVTVFSFHPVKLVTTAEGGAALTQRADLAAKMALFRSHGMTRDPGMLQDQSQGPWYYEQHALGFNYRLTDMQAALGVSQMRRLDEWVARRHEIADRYDAALANLPVTTPRRVPGSRSALHLYVINLVEGATPGRRKVFESMRAQGIGVNVHYIPVHLQPDFRQFGRGKGDYPVAEHYYETAISLPMYASLGDDDQDHVIACLRRALT